MALSALRAVGMPTTRSREEEPAIDLPGFNPVDKAFYTYTNSREPE